MSGKIKTLLLLSASAVLLAACGGAPEVDKAALADGKVSAEATTDMKACRNEAGKRVDDVNCVFGVKSGESKFSWMYIEQGKTMPALGKAFKDGSPFADPELEYMTAGELASADADAAAEKEAKAKKKKKKKKKKDA
jgi:hypothetical protein